MIGSTLALASAAAAAALAVGAGDLLAWQLEEDRLVQCQATQLLQSDGRRSGPRRSREEEEEEDRLVQCQATQLLQSDGRRSGPRRSREEEEEAARGAQNPWPHSRGNSPQYGSTPFSLPGSLNNTLAWSWQHPDGQYHTLVAGSAVIDAQGDVYFGANDGVRKLRGATGALLWYYKPPGFMNNQPTLHGELLLGNTITGYGYAVDIQTGSPVWERKFANRSGMDCGYPGASEGLFLMGVDGSQARNDGNERILAVAVATGDEVWEYRPSIPSWNFMPVFPGDGTAVFMDWTGGVYKLGLHNGTLLWHSPVPGAENSFSDGGVILGPTAAYSCSNPGNSNGDDGEQGLLRAVNLESGAELWKQVLPQPCNSWPGVGHVSPGRLSVVATVGSFASVPPMPGPQPLHGGLMTFDATTGELLWQFQAPPYNSMYAMGDKEGLMERLQHLESSNPVCLPAHWSAPTIAGDGSVYAGRTDGKLYRVRGNVSAVPSSNGPTGSLPILFPTTAGVTAETFDAHGAFLHGGTAWTDGMMAISSCDTVFVFKKQL